MRHHRRRRCNGPLNANRRVPARTSARSQRASQLDRNSESRKHLSESHRQISLLASNRVARRFVPPHARLAQLTEDTVIDGGGPIVTVTVPSSRRESFPDVLVLDAPAWLHVLREYRAL